MSRVDNALALATALVFALAAARSIDEQRTHKQLEEAAHNIALLFRATANYYAVERASVAPTVGAHRCPHPREQPEGGSTGLTPALDISCHAGRAGLCAPTGPHDDAGPGAYDAAVWSQSHVWRGLQFQKFEGHRFHFEYRATNHPPDADGYSPCEFTVTARADLDGDGVYSTFRRDGAIDRHGLRVTSPLTVEQPLE